MKIARCLPLAFLLLASGTSALLIAGPSRAGQETDAGTTTPQPVETPGEWRALFNGVDLAGWTPKITHHPLGENFADTFRVEDGLLKVGYEGYDGFEGQFGHLFWKESLSHYRLRIEYRFVGQQISGGPGWALRNSGVMLHCQDPKTMGLDQDFPVSIEAQMLGGDGEHERPTANLCTPGTNVVMEGELITRHCTNSTSLTYHGEQWVTMEIEVHGGDVIRHRMEGRVVLAYREPQLDPEDPDAKALIGADGELALNGGFLSIQSESHPLEIRKIELLDLDE